MDPKKVQSPTYTYVNVYDDKLLHIDMYRLETFKDLIEK
ncbi:tRNA (adenosine(37)-N6)-threonylcarbamoyltransferase complex ATPase subunit type 1 TsaE [bacterium]|nr:tRNA (adenosine(37)-N6)-threonylcarbamoyltransferase complex ATPase subunit type 1 TsaE [bacterium]